LPEYELQDVASLRSNRDADSQLASALTDRIGHNAIESYGG